MNKLLYKICKLVFGKHSNNSLPRIWILAFDMVIVVIAFLIAMTAMYFNYIKDSSWPFDWGKIFIPIAVYLIMFSRKTKRKEPSRRFAGGRRWFAPMSHPDYPLIPAAAVL